MFVVCVRAVIAFVDAFLLQHSYTLRELLYGYRNVNILDLVLRTTQFVLLT